MTESLGRMVAEHGKTFSPRPALWTRRGKREEVISYADFAARVRECGAGLLSLGVRPGDKVFLLSDNRPEWLIADCGILSIGAINVSRGNDSTAVEIDYIINHSAAMAVFVENLEQLKKLEALRPKLPSVQFVILIQAREEQIPAGVYRFQELLLRGKQLLEQEPGCFEERLSAVEAEDLATLVYTSGTTGPPKGVMLTHRNILSNIEASLTAISIDSDDRLLSILPSWHMLERTVEYIILHQGACLVYTSPKTMRDDLLHAQPTYVLGVPRIWETFYQNVTRKLQEGPPLRRMFVALLFSAGVCYTQAARALRGEHLQFEPRAPMPRLFKKVRAVFTRELLTPAYWLGERMIFRKIRSTTGGKLKAAISGGGSFPLYLDDFYETVGITVINGYGLTESSPVVSLRPVSHNVRGTVGLPIPHTELKVVNEEGTEVPQGSQGVIWVRGPQVMKGYYQNSHTTGMAIKEGGWLDTGDLGRLTVQGDLAITGRAKDTIVLLGGENIEPEPIETALKGCEHIENVIVVGQDRKYLTALIVPPRHLREGSSGAASAPRGGSSEQPAVMALIRKEIANRVNQDRGFKPIERIVRFTLLEEEWTKESGLLTPTLKLKRNLITERYRDVIDRMYQSQ
jgi:long-chain acyl-CoA synthetase